MRVSYDPYRLVMSVQHRHGKTKEARQRARELHTLITRRDRKLCIACAGPCGCFKGFDRGVHREPIDLVELEPGVWGPPRRLS